MPQDVLKSKRAGYGEQIVAALGRQLQRDFGRGFGQRNLFRMMQFAEVFPDINIVSALRTQLGWTHFKAKVFAHAVTCKSQGEEIGYE